MGLPDPIVVTSEELITSEKTGPRHIETRQRVDELVTMRFVGEIAETHVERKLFKAASYRNAPLPPNVRLHAQSALAVEQLERMSRRPSDPPPADGAGAGTGTGVFLPVADYAKFTATLNIVGFAGPGKAAFVWNGQEHPMVPVRLMAPKRDSSPALARVLAGGLPIPPGWAPTADGVVGDTHFCSWMPDYVGPTGRQELYHEGWSMQPVTEEEQEAWGPNPYHPSGVWVWKCWDGGRINGCVTRPARFASFPHGTPGSHRGDTPEHFDSTYQEANWGATAGATTLGSGILTREACERRHVDYALDLITVNSKQGYWWPANRGDGTSSTVVFPTGARFRLPADWQPQGASEFCRMLEQGARDYGLLVGDKTGNCNKFRLEPGCQETEIFEGLNANSALHGFPWGHLQLLDVGSDATPNPLA